MGTHKRPNSDQLALIDLDQLSSRRDGAARVVQEPQFTQLLARLDALEEQNRRQLEIIGKQSEALALLSAGASATSRSAAGGEYAGFALTDVIDLYLKAEKRNLKPSSYLSTVARLLPIRRIIGDLIVSTIGVEMIDFFADERSEEKTRRKKLPSADTIAQEAFAANRVFTWCVSRRKLDRNPIQGFELSRVHKRRLTRYTPADVESVIGFGGNIFLTAWVLGTYDCGLRPIETARIDRDQVNWTTGHLPLRADQAKESVARDVWLSPRTLAAWRALPARFSGGKLLANPTTGRPFCAATRIRWWNAAAERAGLEASPGENTIFYCLRHSLSDDLIDANVTAKAAAGVLGHSIEQQNKHYLSRAEMKQIKVAVETVSHMRRKGPQKSHMLDPEKKILAT